MRFGQGRPAAHPEIYEIAPLTKVDVENFVPAETSKQPGVLKTLRDSHHRIAHLFAMGYRNQEIEEITGYSKPRLSTLRASPAMQELVELYRKDVVQVRQTEADQTFVQITRMRNLAIGEVIDRLEDDEDRPKISNANLIAIAADALDRTGYPKRRESVTLNKDFASRLDKAIERANSAKVIEGEVLPPPNLSPTTSEFTGGGGREPDGQPLSQNQAPALLKRRL